MTARMRAGDWPAACSFKVWRTASGREVEGALVNIGQQRRSSGAEDGAYCSEESKGGCDHGIARSDAERGEREPERVGAAGTTYGKGDSAGAGGGALEAVHRRAENKPLRVADCGYSRQNFSSKRQKFALEVEQRNAHWC